MSTTTQSCSTTTEHFAKYIEVNGICQEPWKTKNIFGRYEIIKIDNTSRPVYKKIESTDGGRCPYLYFHKSKWMINYTHDGWAAKNSWINISSEGIVIA